MHEKLKGNTSDHILQSIDCSFTARDDSEFSIHGGTWNLMDQCNSGNNAWGIDENQEQHINRKERQIKEIHAFFSDIIEQRDFLFVQEADLFFGDHAEDLKKFLLKNSPINLSIVTQPKTIKNKKMVIIYNANKLEATGSATSVFDDTGFSQSFKIKKMDDGSDEKVITLTNVHFDFDKDYAIDDIQAHLKKNETPTIMGGDTNHPVDAFVNAQGHSIALGDPNKITNIARNKDSKTSASMAFLDADEHADKPYKGNLKSYDSFFVYSGKKNTCLAEVNGKGFETKDGGKTYHQASCQPEPLRFESKVQEKILSQEHLLKKYKNFTEYFKSDEQPPENFWLDTASIDSILNVIVPFESLKESDKIEGKAVNIDRKSIRLFVACNNINDFKSKLEKVLAEKNPVFPLTCHAPCNVGEHFVYIKAEITADKKINITYKDSMSLDIEAKKAELQKNLTFSKYAVTIKAESNKKQKDSFRCADYTMQEILTELKPDHPIAKEKNPAHLREHVITELEKIELAKIKESKPEKYQEYQSKHKNIAFKHKIENLKSPDSGIKEIKTTQADKTGVLSKIIYQDNAEIQIKKTASTCEISTKNHTEKDFERLIKIAKEAGATSVEISGPHTDKIKLLCEKNKLTVSNKPKPADLPASKMPESDLPSNPRPK